MPPRVPIPATGAACPLSRAGANPTRCLAQTRPSQASVGAAVAAGFSTTGKAAARNWTNRVSRRRAEFYSWLDTAGRKFRHHRPGSGPCYIQRPTIQKDDTTQSLKGGYEPFPMNSAFKSEPVLSDGTRELIWSKIMREGQPIKVVSAEYGIDIRRVAAVVRLKEVEKDWISKGKRLAKPYADAIMGMLPVWNADTQYSKEPFEPINEIHMHPYTMQQIFWPTSESRHFTREDAATALHPTLLPADKRLPHPELIQMEKDIMEGRSAWEAAERFKQAAMETERAAAEKQAAKAHFEEKLTTRVESGRFEFRFKQYNSQNVGPTGKARAGKGWRYGAPFEDRSKGHQIDIPTSVP
ncbi:eukaryotic mitochondrial regulator protein-domain-containing protein [Xylariaceae sp. FL0594]|nr:eukaryotic mitochondrial regulator protein-domain-containing protein [Xylariaceae sp. FL0594]